MVLTFDFFVNWLLLLRLGRSSLKMLEFDFFLMNFINKVITARQAMVRNMQVINSGMKNLSLESAWISDDAEWKGSELKVNSFDAIANWKLFQFTTHFASWLVEHPVTSTVDTSMMPWVETAMILSSDILSINIGRKVIWVRNVCPSSYQRSPWSRPNKRKTIFMGGKAGWIDLEVEK